jgi:hypothetical protein
MMPEEGSSREASQGEHAPSCKEADQGHNPSHVAPICGSGSRSRLDSPVSTFSGSSILTAEPVSARYHGMSTGRRKR